MRISDFGQTGPYRDWVATDAVLEAVSGMVWKAGIPSKPPLIPPAPIAYDVAGIVAAFATLATLRERNRSGYGQIVDLSVLEAVAQTTDWSMSSASISVGQGIRPVEVRMGSGPLYTIYACKGGYVRLVVLSPRQWRAMWEWLGKPEAFADPHFESFVARLQNADVLIPLYTEHFSTMTMEEVSAEAQRRGIVCTPVLRPEEVLANEHMLSRGTFVDAEVVPGVSGPMASGFFEIDGVRQGPRSRAPRLGEHSHEVLETRVMPKSQPSDYRQPPSLPLSGLRVLDFGIGGVGVEAGRLFAEYGADVIKIETRTYPDFIRVVLGGEMSPSFASSSRSKRSFGVNAKNPEGFKILKRLIEACDVLIENSKTGAMEGMGIGWETIQQVEPLLRDGEQPAARFARRVERLDRLRAEHAADRRHDPPLELRRSGVPGRLDIDLPRPPRGPAVRDQRARDAPRARAHAGGRPRRGGAGGSGDGDPRRPALEGGPRARLGEAARQSQRARRAVGRLSVRGRAAVVRDLGPRRHRLAESRRGDRAARVGGRSRARERGRRGSPRTTRSTRSSARGRASTPSTRWPSCCSATACRAGPCSRARISSTIRTSPRAAIRAGSINRTRAAWRSRARRSAPPARRTWCSPRRRSSGNTRARSAPNLLRLDDATIDRLIAEGALEVPR